MTEKKQELNFTNETIEEIGNQIIDSILDHLPDFLESGVRNGLLPDHVVRDIAEYIAEPEEASINKLEIVFLKAKGQLHKRVREFVFKKLPETIKKHGVEHYGIDA